MLLAQLSTFCGWSWLWPPWSQDLWENKWMPFQAPSGRPVQPTGPHVVCGSRSVVSDSLGPHGLYSPWDSPDQNTGVGSLSLLQDIFPTQGSNPGLPHCRRLLYQLSHKGSPRILEWVAYLFASGSSQPRNQTGVSSIAGGFFTN